MSTEKRPNGIRRILTAALASALIAGVGTWITFGANKPSGREVYRIVQENSPYLRDRALLLAKLGEFSATLEKQSEAIARLSIQQASLGGKIERMLKR